MEEIKKDWGATMYIVVVYPSNDDESETDEEE